MSCHVIPKIMPYLRPLAWHSPHGNQLQQHGRWKWCISRGCTDKQYHQGRFTRSMCQCIYQTQNCNQRCLIGWWFLCLTYGKSGLVAIAVECICTNCTMLDGCSLQGIASTLCRTMLLDNEKQQPLTGQKPNKKKKGNQNQVLNWKLNWSLPPPWQAIMLFWQLETCQEACQIMMQGGKPNWVSNNVPVRIKETPYDVLARTKQKPDNGQRRW